MPYNFSWQNLQAASAEDIYTLGYNNKVVQRLNALKERFEEGHKWSTGRHYNRGASGFASVQGAGTPGSFPSAMTAIANTTHNLASVSHQGTGHYRFTWTNSVSNNGVTIAQVNHFGGSPVSAHMTTFTDQSTALTDVYVYSLAGALTDLSAFETLCVVTKEDTPSGGVFTETWTDINLGHTSQIFGDDSFNEIRGNIYAVKERFEVAHDYSVSTHDFPGAVAMGTIKGNDTGEVSLLSGSSHNVAKVTNLPGSGYRVDFVKDTLQDSVLVCSLGHSKDAQTITAYRVQAIWGSVDDWMLIWIENTSGVVQVLGPEQTVSFVVYKTIADDTPSNSFNEVAKRIPDSMFGDDTFNDIREDLLAHKERFEYGHYFDIGAHKEVRSIAQGCLTGNGAHPSTPTINTDSDHNLTSVSHEATGQYRFTWAFNMPLNAVVLCHCDGSVQDSIYAVSQHFGDYTDVYVFDETNTAQDLLATQHLSCEIMINPWEI